MTDLNNLIADFSAARRKLCTANSERALTGKGYLDPLDFRIEWAGISDIAPPFVLRHGEERKCSGSIEDCLAKACELMRALAEQIEKEISPKS